MVFTFAPKLRPLAQTFPLNSIPLYLTTYFVLFFFFFSLFLFMAAPTAHGISQARDGIQDTAATRAAAVEFLTHCTMAETPFCIHFKCTTPHFRTNS